YQVTANNLANAEVPNFKRTSINFESELKRALESEANAKDTFKMTATDERHIHETPVRDYRSVEPRRVLDYTSTTKANGNNVDAEQEAMEILKIQLNYQLLSQLQAFEFSQMKVVLK
ncbi:MAG: flagellar basal body rod protein FlgB, partial [Treponemataceae bacterium]|nr:flagellar basal body rod protein FlgB [Treponemataceae bacterium]